MAPVLLLEWDFEVIIKISELLFLTCVLEAETEINPLQEINDPFLTHQKQARQISRSKAIRSQQLLQQLMQTKKLRQPDKNFPSFNAEMHF